MGDDVILVIVVATALAFDFTNGFHDTANVVATSISTRALPPRIAIGLASLFERGIDPMMVIRWKDIFDRLEDAIDATEKVANILEGIVIKNR